MANPIFSQSDTFSRRGPQGYAPYQAQPSQQSPY